MLIIHLSNVGESPTASSTTVRRTIRPTTIEGDLTTCSERRTPASDFPNILIVAAPGNTVLLVAQSACQSTVVRAFTKSLAPGASDRTMTYASQSQGRVGYNETNADGGNVIVPVASYPGAATMELFYPTLATKVGHFDFDPLNVGHECEVVLNGTCYQGNAASGQRVPLTFTDGSVLLSA